MSTGEHKVFYMVWREGGFTPTFKHDSAASASKEAERLARLNPCTKFHVLVCVSTVQTIDLQWTSITTDQIPF